MLPPLNVTGSMMPSLNVTGSMLPPMGSVMGSGFGMRGESGMAPEGPRNLPPQNGGYSDKLASITDSRIFVVKEILKFLPPVEQDLLAGKLFFFN
jgi:hypothetical protein